MNRMKDFNEHVLVTCSEEFDSHFESNEDRGLIEQIGGPDPSEDGTITDSIRNSQKGLCGENEMDGIEKGQSSITEMRVFHGVDKKCSKRRGIEGERRGSIKSRELMVEEETKIEESSQSLHVFATIFNVDSVVKNGLVEGSNHVLDNPIANGTELGLLTENLELLLCLKDVEEVAEDALQLGKDVAVHISFKQLSRAIGDGCGI